MLSPLSLAITCTWFRVQGVGGGGVKGVGFWGKDAGLGVVFCPRSLMLSLAMTLIPTNISFFSSSRSCSYTPTLPIRHSKLYPHTPNPHPNPPPKIDCQT